MKSSPDYDDAVVGAGILGLAHAYHLARRGHRVIVFERHPIARGASVRNFGMIWPIGQSSGKLRDLARSSLKSWLKVLKSSGSWHDPCGSMHLAYHDDEAQVLQEFARQRLENGDRIELLDPKEARRRSPAIRQEGLRCAIWSPDEVCVDPREVVAGLPRWLSREHGVRFRFDAAVTRVDGMSLLCGDERFSADRIWICSGDETRILYPDLLQRSGIVPCKLQMMRSASRSDDFRIGPMLAAGLTLRHYASFRDCPSLPALKDRVARETPWFDEMGIHVLVSQNGHGELTIGDSHEYGGEIEPFDKAQIDEWTLDYLATFLEVPGLRIASRWHGVYAKHPDLPFVILEPTPEVAVITGVGGAGMTLSFGLAQKVVEDKLGCIEN